MRQKLGLLAADGAEEDQELINDLLQTMHDTGADFTNTFRCLSKFPMPSAAPSGTPDSTTASMQSCMVQHDDHEVDMYRFCL